jgi:RNA polymerase sigma-70 factor (ECF subfamily)
MPNEPENLGLLALMLLQDSRRAARVSEDGQLVTLEEQDRSLWDRSHIENGTELLQTALRMHSVGPYQLQAAIAAIHAEALTAGSTDWRQISALYAELARRNPSPVIRLNYAVAVAMATGIEQGLALMDELESSGALENYYLLHSARADLLRRLNRRREAIAAYQRALDLTANSVEQNYLRRRLQNLTAS